MNSPRMTNGASIVRSPTPGPALFVDAYFRDVRRQADRGRRGRCLAFVAGGLLREPGPDSVRHELARQVHHRRGGPHQFPQRQARRLSDPDRRSGRRSSARAAPAQYAPGAPAFPRLQAGLQDADLAGLSRPTIKHIDNDVQFGVTRHLIGNYVRHDEPRAGTADVTPPWYSLDHALVMERGVARCRERRSAAKPTASGRKFRIWSRRKRPPTRPALLSR